MKSKAYEERVLLIMVGIGIISLFLPWMNVANEQISLFTVWMYIFNKDAHTLFSLANESNIALSIKIFSIIGMFPVFCYAIHVYYVFKKCDKKQMGMRPNYAVAGSIYALVSGLGFGLLIVWMKWNINKNIQIVELIFGKSMKIGCGVGLFLFVISAIILMVVEWKRNEIEDENL